MRVLITGHLGYIGTVLTPMVAARGHEVTGLDSDLYRRCNFAGEPHPCKTIIKDIRDVKPTDLEGFDAVLHLAGLSNDPLGNLNPEITYDINHRGTVELARCAREAGVSRFIFSSSCSTYGASGDKMLDEDAAFNPVTPYGHSKVLAEEGLSRLASPQFSPIYLRNATAYGVSVRLRFDLVLNNLTAWALATGKVYLKSDGTPWRPIVHIEDISRAFVAALEAPRDAVHDKAFNVGRQEENYRISEIAAIVAATVPNCRVEFAPGAGPDKRCYRVDCSRIRRVLPAFQPVWTAALGARELYDALVRERLTQADFEGARFNRIDHIQYLLREGLLDVSLRWKDSSSWSKQPYSQAMPTLA